MSIFINRDQKSPLPEEVENLKEKGLFFNIKASFQKVMEPIYIPESAEKLKAIYNLGIATFNPNIISLHKGEGALSAVISDNAIMTIESKDFICLMHLHKKQMRSFRDKIFQEIYEQTSGGSFIVNVFVNEETWDMNPFNISLFKVFEGITEYRVQYASTGAEIIVY